MDVAWTSEQDFDPNTPHAMIAARQKTELERRAGWRATKAFTLTEVLISTTVLGLAMGITMPVFIAAMRRAQHTEDGLKGTAQLRYAADMIAQSVRSASQDLTVAGNGTQLIVAPADLGYAVVQDTTWVDAAHTVKGSKSNQRMLHVADATVTCVASSAWKTTTRPSGAIATSDVSTYFIDTSGLPTSNLANLFHVGDTITIPATAYGAQTTGVINSVSNNSGTKTITLSANLGVDVPNGTTLLATSGARAMFEVQSSGDLRYYPDNTDLTKYSVLAQSILVNPLSNPAVRTSATTKPFVKLSAGYVQINLQQIPKGTDAGRTMQTAQTTAYTRTTGADL